MPTHVAQSGAYVTTPDTFSHLAASSGLARVVVMDEYPSEEALLLHPQTLLQPSTSCWPQTLEVLLAHAAILPRGIHLTLPNTIPTPGSARG